MSMPCLVEVVPSDGVTIARLIWRHITRCGDLQNSISPTWVNELKTCKGLTERYSVKHRCWFLEKFKNPTHQWLETSKRIEADNQSQGLNHQVNNRRIQHNSLWLSRAYARRTTEACLEKQNGNAPLPTRLIRRYWSCGVINNSPTGVAQGCHCKSHDELHDSGGSSDESGANPGREVKPPDKPPDQMIYDKLIQEQSTHQREKLLHSP